MSFNPSLSSMLQNDVERQQSLLNDDPTVSRKKPKKEDNRRAVVNFRLFVVLRPPFASSSSQNNSRGGKATDQQQSLHQLISNRAATTKNYQKLAEISRLSKIARKVDAYAFSNKNNTTSFATMLGEASGSGSGSKHFDVSSRSKFGGLFAKNQQKLERERIRAEADGDEDNIIRDVEADDEADAIWDEHAIAVIPFVMQITYSQTTVSDVMERAWPYVVELWRNQGRFWHKNMVPLPISQSSNWFALRMIGKKWHDPSRAPMRSCLEPPVSTVLAGFDYSGFEGLQTSLTQCSFQERGLLSTTLIKKLLPEDPNAHLKAMASSGSKFARMMGSSSRFSGANTAVSSAVHGGLTDANRRQRDLKNANSSEPGAPLPRFRMNLLLTLSTDFLMLEHIVCCERQTRQATLQALDGFFVKMKEVERTSLDCAFKRTLHRQRIEKLFTDLMDQETKRRGQITDQEIRVFAQQIRNPYEESQATLLPVLQEAHAIRLSWRAKLAQDMERAKKLKAEEEGENEMNHLEDEMVEGEREISPSCGVD